MKNIGIIGQGFVGTAVYEGMRHAFNIHTYDKAKGYKAIIDGTEMSMNRSDFGIAEIIELTDGPVFVCVPTPMDSDGSCNTSIVESVISDISDAAKSANKTNIVVIIKSTVVPGTTQRMNRTYNNIHTVFNPEFLTERNSVNDFKNQDRIIVGGPHEGTSVVKQMYETAYPNVPVTKTSSTIAEMVKYMTNCFLATKVSFANEMSKICDKLEVDYDKVVEYATKDKRLGTSHWSVPGPDGKKGFSGSCFPKDLNAILKLSESLGVDIATMRGAWQTNLNVRPDKDWEQLKGRAVTDPCEF